MAFNGEYQVATEKLTGIVRHAGFTDLRSHLDKDLFDIVDYPDKPEGVMVTKYPTPADMRDQMAALYKSADLSLRQVFAPILAAVNTTLDLGDYELAIALIEGADMNQIEDDAMKKQATDIKTQFLQGVAAIVTMSNDTAPNLTNASDAQI